MTAHGGMHMEAGGRRFTFSHLVSACAELGLRAVRSIVDVEELWLIESRPAPGDADPDGLRMRPATEEDWPRLAPLFEPRLVAEARARGDLCLVAERGSALIGCCWLSTAPHRIPKYRVLAAPGPGEAYYHGLVVAPAARGRGVATALSEACWRFGRELGYDRSLGHISPRNPATPRIFVERFGHRIRERQRVLLLGQRLGFPLPAVTTGPAASLAADHTVRQ